MFLVVKNWRCFVGRSCREFRFVPLVFVDHCRKRPSGLSHTDFVTTAIETGAFEPRIVRRSNPRWHPILKSSRILWETTGVLMFQRSVITAGTEFVRQPSFRPKLQSSSNVTDQPFSSRPLPRTRHTSRRSKSSTCKVFIHREYYPPLLSPRKMTRSYGGSDKTYLPRKMKSVPVAREWAQLIRFMVS